MVEGGTPPRPMAADPEPSAAPRESGVAYRLLSARLHCENCDRETIHRILRWDRGSVPDGRVGRGIARCRECRFTHPFEVARPAEVEVDRIVSTGSSSHRSRLRLPKGTELAVGERLPDSGSGLLIRRIDSRAKRSVERAPVEEVATVWLTPDVRPAIPVSLIDGARTTGMRWEPASTTEVGIGDRLRVEGVGLEVVALRARGHTWRRPGDRFPVSEVQRLYGRSTVRPPAGRRDWRRERETPSSRESSRSRSSRSRSGPGRSRTRNVPRARTASGGAAVQRVAPP